MWAEYIEQRKKQRAKEEEELKRLKERQASAERRNPEPRKFVQSSKLIKSHLIFGSLQNQTDQEKGPTSRPGEADARAEEKTGGAKAARNREFAN